MPDFPQVPTYVPYQNPLDYQTKLQALANARTYNDVMQQNILNAQQQNINAQTENSGMQLDQAIKRNAQVAQWSGALSQLPVEQQTPDTYKAAFEKLTSLGIMTPEDKAIYDSQVEGKTPEQLVQMARTHTVAAVDSLNQLTHGQPNQKPIDQGNQIGVYQSPSDIQGYLTGRTSLTQTGNISKGLTPSESTDIQQLPDGKGGTNWYQRGQLIRNTPSNASSGGGMTQGGNAAAGGSTTGAGAPAATSTQGLADRIEGYENSSTNTAARNPASSAMGNGQFLSTTFLEVMKKSFPQLVAGKSDNDILAMRANPDIAKAATDAYAQQNASTLAAKGLPVTPGTIYMAHLVGAGGASAVLNASPNTPLSSVLSADAIKANPQYRRMTAGDLRQMTESRMRGIPAPSVAGGQQVMPATVQTAGPGAGTAAAASPQATAAPAAGGQQVQQAGGLPQPLVSVPAQQGTMQQTDSALYAQHLQQAPQLKTDISDLTDAYNLYKGLTGGYGTEWFTRNRSMINNVAQGLGIDTGSLDSTDARLALARKNLQRVTNSMAGRTDASAQAAHDASPNTDTMNPTGALEAMQQMIGDRRMKLAGLLSQDPTTNGVGYQQNSARYALNHDRFGFAADLMTPAEIAARVQSLGGPKSAKGREFLQSAMESQKLFGRGPGESLVDGGGM